MSRSTFRVLFYLKRNAPKKNGLVPVICRITVNGKISQFSCKLDVEEKLWSVSLGRMSGRSIVAQEANRMLDKIGVGINKAYQETMYEIPIIRSSLNGVQKYVQTVFEICKFKRQAVI